MALPSNLTQSRLPAGPAQPGPHHGCSPSTRAGGTSGSPSGAAVVPRAPAPPADGAGRPRSGQVVIGFLPPLTDADGIWRLTRGGVIGLALESIPRITRAQPMDALSSQATVSG